VQLLKKAKRHGDDFSLCLCCIVPIQYCWTGFIWKFRGRNSSKDTMAIFSNEGTQKISMIPGMQGEIPSFKKGRGECIT